MLTISSPDVEAVEEMIPGLPLQITRLSSKGGHAVLDAVTAGEATVLAGRFEFPVVTEGELAPDRVLVAFQRGGGAGTWDGHEFALDRAWVYGPGADHHGAATHPPDWTTVTLPLAAIRNDIDLRTPARLVVDDATVGQLRTTVRAAFDLSSGGVTPLDRAARIERDLTAAVETLLGDETPPEMKSVTAHRIVRQCVALADDIDPIPSAGDLAAVLGCSDRWIRVAFSRIYGVSVTAFFRARALHCAHRELLRADPAATSVTEVAMRWGFWHLGRFAGTYRRHFGELPSETITRMP